jgi:hypothetical protein
MTGKSDSSFAVVRFNKRTYQSGGVVAVIKGTKAAERILKDFDSLQSEESRRAGWGYFLEKTDLPPGMDPEKATKLRQVRLDSQESRALHSAACPARPSDRKVRRQPANLC